MFVLNIWFITHIGKSIWCTAQIISSREHRLRNTPEAKAYYCIYGHCAHTITIRHTLPYVFTFESKWDKLHNFDCQKSEWVWLLIEIDGPCWGTSQVFDAEYIWIGCEWCGTPLIRSRFQVRSHIFVVPPILSICISEYVNIASEFNTAWCLQQCQVTVMHVR